MPESVDTQVSFFTCCYKADWEFFLKQGRLKEMIERCHHAFATKNLIINNVDDRQEVNRYAKLAVQEGVIDHYFFSEDYTEQVLEHFSIKRKDFWLDGFDGYWYSVAPLTAIFLCSTNYMLYFMGDCMPDKRYTFDWVKESVHKLNKHNVFCITPYWQQFNTQKVDNFLMEDQNCFYDRGFSDQCILAQTQKLKGTIYNEYNAGSEIFPIYGGNHFERRVFCYISNKKHLRGILKNVGYTHEKLVMPQFFKEKKFSLRDKTKYVIAKVKKVFRRRNIFVKYLLR